MDNIISPIEDLTSKGEEINASLQEISSSVEYTTTTLLSKVREKLEEIKKIMQFWRL